MGAVEGDDGCECHAAEVGQGVLVVAGGDSAPVLDRVEAAFDAVAVLVDVRVECWWPARRVTLWSCVARSGRGVREWRARSSLGAAERGSSHASRPYRPAAGSARDRARGACRATVRASGYRRLPGREQHRHSRAPLVGESVDFRRLPAAGTAQRVICWLTRQILVIRPRPYVDRGLMETGTRRVLMSADAGRIDRQQPGSIYLYVHVVAAVLAHRGEHRGIRAIVLSAAFPDRLPSPELLGEVKPRTAEPEPRRDAFQRAPVIVPRTTPATSATGKHRLDNTPQLVRDHTRSKHQPIITPARPPVKQTRPSQLVLRRYSEYR